MSDLPGRSAFERDDRAGAAEEGWGSPVPAQYGSLRSVRPPVAPETREEPAPPLDQDEGRDRWGVTSLLRRLAASGDESEDRPRPAASDAPPRPVDRRPAASDAAPSPADRPSSGVSAAAASAPPAAAWPAPAPRAGAPPSGPSAPEDITAVGRSFPRPAAEADPSPAGAAAGTSPSRGSSVGTTAGDSSPTAGTAAAPAPWPDVAGGDVPDAPPPGAAAPGGDVPGASPLGAAEALGAASGASSLGAALRPSPVVPTEPATNPGGPPPAWWATATGADRAAAPGAGLTGPDVMLAGRRRRRRPGRIRTRATVRHIDIGTVIKVSLVFWLLILVALVVASLLLWVFADAFGSLPSIDKSVRTLFSLKSFQLHPGSVALYTAAGGIVIAVAGMIGTIMFALIYNLIADVVGGIRVELESFSSE